MAISDSFFYISVWLLRSRLGLGVAVDLTLGS